MLEDELLKMIVRGTRGGRKNAMNKPRRKTMKKTHKGGAKSGYMAHVKQYWLSHPNLTWKEAMSKARSSYSPKRGSGSKMSGKKRGCARAGTMASGRVGDRLSKVNSTLRNKKAISRTLKALSAIPTPLSGYANDAGLLAEALGYGRRR